MKNGDAGGGIGGWCSAKTLHTILSGHAEKTQWHKSDFRLPLDSSPDFPEAGMRWEIHHCVYGET